MSFVTRCPHCGTAFRVVPDQLKISDGWVRCGQCQEIFDATLSLQPWWPGSQAVSEPVVPQAADASTEQLEAPEQPPWQDAAPLEQAAAAESHAEAGLVSETLLAEPAHGLEPEPEAPAEPKAEEPEPYLLHNAHVDEWPVAEAATFLEGSKSVSAEENRVDDLDFVQQARRKAFWRRGSVRFVLGTSVLLLSLVLVLQGLWMGRDWVAATLPAARPWLGSACAMAGCQIAPLRRIEALSLDEVSLRRQASGTYLFEAQIHNPTAQALAVPAMELALTDETGAVMAQRVILPTDWPELPLTLAARTDWPLRLELEIKGLSAQVIAGYRALIFYP